MVDAAWRGGDVAGPGLKKRFCLDDEAEADDVVEDVAEEGDDERNGMLLIQI